MELSALGMAQPLSSNILEFLKALPDCANEKGITFSTPTEIVTKLKSVSQLDVPYPMSWVDEEEMPQISGFSPSTGCQPKRQPNCQPVAFQNGSSICRASSSVIS